KISPEAAQDPTIAPEERDRGTAAAADLQMRSLSRMWQMLLKALEEVAAAPNAMMAAEMAIIRLTHVADLPSPEELVRKLQNTEGAPATHPSGPSGGNAPSAQNATSVQSQTTLAAPQTAHEPAPTAVLQNSGATAIQVAPEVSALSRFAQFEDVVSLIRARRDMKLLYEVENYIRLASYTPGRIEFQPADDAPGDFAHRLAQALQNFTGQRWGVSLVNDGGTPTIAEQKSAALDDLHAQVKEHPLVQSVLAAFPKAEIRDVKSLDELISGDEVLSEIPEEDDDNWDPFEQE
ncbi:MAG: DNA polymerase III subunit gamma/tau, partial [Pseudomonadota bacterium]